MKSFLDLAHERYSVRALSSRPVEPEKLQAIVEAAAAAPTAVNLQPVKLWLFQSPEALEKVRSTTRFAFVNEAPAVFLVGSSAEAGWVRPFDQKPFAEVDASIVATHMMLAVQDLGLGSTWVGYFDADKLKTLFPETAPYELIALFPVGYPAEGAAPSPRHTQRKPLEEFLTVL